MKKQKLQIMSWPKGRQISLGLALCLLAVSVSPLESFAADTEPDKNTTAVQPLPASGADDSRGFVLPKIQVGQNDSDAGANLTAAPSLSASYAAGSPNSTRRFQLKPLPPSNILGHDENSRLSMGPFHLSTFVDVPLLKPLKLDAAYNEPITLKDALTYAMHNNLPIKISRESWNYQRYQLYGSTIAAFPVPNLSMGLSQTWANVLTTGTTSNALVFQTLLSYPVFQGGAAVYSLFAQYYRDKAFRHAYNATINDTLLDVYQKYTNLVLQHAILQIRSKSLDASMAQLSLSDTQYSAGTGTIYGIMQARTQVATDKQAMLQQQIAVRQAALALAFALNLPMAINLVPQENAIFEYGLMDRTASINSMVDVAEQHRPEVRQYELFRMSAQRNIQLAASTLYPTVSFFTAYTHSQAIVSPVGGNVSGVATAQLSSTGTSFGTASNNALGQTASFSPTGSTTANSGVNNTTNTSINAGSGGLPLNLVQSGSLVTSGAVAPSIAGGNGGANGATGATNLSGSGTSSFGVFPGIVNSYQAGLRMSWNLSDMGLQNVVSMVSARALARQTLLQANQQYILVNAQVRSAYVNALNARDQIDNAAALVASTREAMRQADVRVKTGTGTRVELIVAQRDYVNSLASQAQAIINSNLAQAQLLHDMGVISIHSLIDGYKISEEQKPTSKKRGGST